MGLRTRVWRPRSSTKCVIHVCSCVCGCVHVCASVCACAAPRINYQVCLSAGYFDEHEQTLNDTYRTSMLPLPPMTTSIDANDQTIADTWGAGMQALAQVVAKRGDTMPQHAIDVALEFNESGLAWLWKSDYSLKPSVGKLASVTREAFASVFSEEALGPGQLAAPSEEHPILALQAIEVDDFPQTSTVLWSHSLSDDTSSLLQRIDHEHAHMTKTMDLEKRPSSLTRSCCVLLYINWKPVAYLLITFTCVVRKTCHFSQLPRKCFQNRAQRIRRFRHPVSSVWSCQQCETQHHAADSSSL